MKQTMSRRLWGLVVMALFLTFAQGASAMPKPNTYRVVETNEKGWVVEVGPETGFHVLASEKLSLARAYKEATGVPLSYKALDIPENWEMDKQGRKIRPRFIPSCHHKGDGFEGNPSRDIEVWNTCVQNENTPIVALVAGETGRLLIKMEPVQSLEEKNKELDEFRTCQTSIACLSEKLKDLGGVPVPTGDVRKIQDEAKASQGESATLRKANKELEEKNAALASKADIAGTISNNFGTWYVFGLAIFVGLAFIGGRRSSQAQAEAFKQRAFFDLKEERDALKHEKAELTSLRRDAKTKRNLERDHKTVSEQVKQLEVEKATLSERHIAEAKCAILFKRQNDITLKKNEALEAQLNGLKRANLDLATSKQQAEQALSEKKALLTELQSEVEHLKWRKSASTATIEAFSAFGEVGNDAVALEKSEEHQDKMLKRAAVLLTTFAELCETNEIEMIAAVEWIYVLAKRREEESRRRRTEPMNLGVATKAVDLIAKHLSASQSKEPDGRYAIIDGVANESLQPAPIPVIEEVPLSDTEQPSLASQQLGGARMFPGSPPVVVPEDLRQTAVRQENPLAQSVSAEPEDPQERLTVLAPDSDRYSEASPPLVRVDLDLDEGPHVRVGQSQQPSRKTERPSAPGAVRPPVDKGKSRGRIQTNLWGHEIPVEVRQPYPEAGPRPPNYDSKPPPPPPPEKVEEETGDEEGCDKEETSVTDAKSDRSTVVSIKDAKRGRKRRRHSNGS
ncbi:hypothetical protein KJ781_00400 [Patescibacteria group bacterium]|nr:hypothetical protein [Patescibacteria group bacterium]MBU1448296.1 hypothetical protein [Patescibacteria group bacterium]MBU2613289.1 hypothetical protein [Patescibacteria group bacterium]